MSPWPGPTSHESLGADESAVMGISTLWVEELRFVLPRAPRAAGSGHGSGQPSCRPLVAAYGCDDYTLD